MTQIKRITLLLCFLASSTLLSTGCSAGRPFPGKSVQWKEHSFIAGGCERQPQTFSPTGLKVTDDATYLMIRVDGYEPPRSYDDVEVEVESRRQAFQRRIDTWSIILNNDSLDSREIMFMPGSEGTRCSDAFAKFRERRGVLEVAFPLQIVATTPVQVRVERRMLFYNDGVEQTRAVYSLPAGGWSVYHSPNLPVDTRTPSIERVELTDLFSQSAIITWQSSKRITGRIELAEDGEKLRTICDIDLLRDAHQVELRQLHPDTAYRYRITGFDLAGNPAQPATGEFRTAVDSIPYETSGEFNVPWREVELTAAGPQVAIPGGVSGIWAAAGTRTVCKLNREASPGLYKLSICLWNDADAQPIDIRTGRSRERPFHTKTVATIPAFADEKLHHYEILLRTPAPFDRIIFATRTGHSGPITSIRLYEMSERLARPAR